MTPCIEWQGATLPGGYGVTEYEGRTQTAHRVAYKRVHGDIPKGMVVMHLCDNPRCVNIEHLKIGTQKENRMDCIRKGRANAPSAANHYNAKLDWETVAFIRNSDLSIKELMELLGHSRSTIADVIHHRTWRIK